MRSCSCRCNSLRRLRQSRVRFTNQTLRFRTHVTLGLLQRHELEDHVAALDEPDVCRAAGRQRAGDRRRNHNRLAWLDDELAADGTAQANGFHRDFGGLDREVLPRFGRQRHGGEVAFGLRILDLCRRGGLGGSGRGSLVAGAPDRDQRQHEQNRPARSARLNNSHHFTSHDLPIACSNRTVARLTPSSASTRAASVSSKR